MENVDYRYHKSFSGSIDKNEQSYRQYGDIGVVTDVNPAGDL